MMEEGLFRLLAWIERLGVWLSILAWATAFGGAAAMAWVLRKESRIVIWRPAVWVGIVALAANLADYFATLDRSPDLSLEANPLWRNVVDHYGLTFAKWYGFTGKILVSVLAAQMFAFYLANRGRLFPAEAGSLWEFAARMGRMSRGLRERLVVLFTAFAFFFAGINLLYFYIAYVNWLRDPELLERLPSAPAAVAMLVAGLATAFLWLTYRAYRAARAPH